MDVLERIKYYMKKNEWTEYRLSQKSGIPQSTLNSLFRKNNSPSISTLEIICNTFEITLSEFFADGEKIIGLTDEQLLMINKMEHLTLAQKTAIYNLIDSI